MSVLTLDRWLDQIARVFAEFGRRCFLSARHAQLRRFPDLLVSPEAAVRRFRLTTLTLRRSFWIAFALSFVLPPFSASFRLVAQETRVDPAGRAVLITGATSGIGRLTTELLASRGFFVYAGARSDADMAALNSIDNVQAIRLDVTVPGQIEAAVATVRAGGRGLYALINNAGTATLGPISEIRDEDLDFDLRVNVWGPVRVTRAFAPMIVESRGRIATTTSIAGMVPYVLSSPYVISKYAAEGFVDQLAVEMAPLGVAVAAIEPGAYDSRIGQGMSTRLREAGYGGAGSLFAGRFEGLADRVADRSALEEPHEVAQAYYDFLTAPSPRRRWMVVPGKREAELTITTLMQRIADVNQGDHAYPRDELVRMLDAALQAGSTR